MDLIKHEKELVWLQILYLFLIPTLLLYFKIIPGNFRVLILLSISILIYGIARHEQWKNEDFGIKKNWTKESIPYIIFTIIGIFFLVFLAKTTIHQPFLNWWKNARFLLLFIPLSVLQEFVFRGILMHMLRRAFTSPLFIILLNAALFTIIHIIYLNSFIVLPAMFIAGVGFAWMYYKYKNLVLISVSHTILNFVAMILGFFIIR
ncbi:MAG: CPBP family intramembrane glutamic endopeptidase [Candidatus Paceibacterota bacterium]